MQVCSKSILELLGLELYFPKQKGAETVSFKLKIANIVIKVLYMWIDKKKNKSSKGCSQ